MENGKNTRKNPESDKGETIFSFEIDEIGNWTFYDGDGNVLPKCSGTIPVCEELERPIVEDVEVIGGHPWFEQKERWE